MSEVVLILLQGLLLLLVKIKARDPNYGGVQCWALLECALSQD